MNASRQDATAAVELPTTPGARLRVEDLRVCLAETDVDVVDEVGFEVRAGEMLGLVGETGSGKTTVALALLGYARRGLRIDSGRVLLDDIDVLGLPAADLQGLRGLKVAYVPQDPASALNPALRIGRQITEALRVHPGVASDIDARVEEVFDEVHLSTKDGYLERYPHQLSGGQQQRVALAMAFACRPSLIVLDEPTTGLDVTTQRHVLDTVRRLCSEHGVAAVYVSHDLAVVGGLVANVAVLYAGRIAEIGPTEEVFGAPAHPYTRGLLRAIPSPERSGVLHGIPGQPPRPGQRPHGCFFQERCDFRIAECAAPPPVVQVSSRQVRCVRAHEVSGAEANGLEPLAGRALAADAILGVRDLSASYRELEVLHGVSFALPAESCVAVVGESGSGKTTLARCIAGLHTNYEGEVHLGDALLGPGSKQRPKDLLRRVQLVFQNPYTSLNPRKTVADLIMQPLAHFFGLGRAEGERRVASVLEDVSLSSQVMRRYPDQLSGGERQRVAIARALVVEPDLLICDEVTSALDVSVQAVIVELLRRLQAERRLSMLFITHNLALVRSIAQSVVVLENGAVVESGSTEEVLDRPSSLYTATLIEDAPKLATALSGP
jgi:peptide/nickel transport system ATP-binding protein